MLKPRVIRDLYLSADSVSFKLTRNRKFLAMQEKQITRSEAFNDKMAASIESLRKVTEEAKAMMAQIVQISVNNLEAKRLKLRAKEVKSLDWSKVQNKDVDSRKRKLEECTDSRKTRVLNVKEHDKTNDKEQEKPNQSVELIKRFENELIYSKINVKREYKLTQKSNYHLWLDCLKSGLMSNNLLDVIDSKTRDQENLSEQIVLKRKSLVRDITINDLDENYHKKFFNETDPKEIIKKLRGHSKNESNVTHTSVRARLYQIKMKKDEKVIDFCERFDSIIREYETYKNAMTLTEQEKRSSFYQAAASIISELRSADLITRRDSDERNEFRDNKIIYFTVRGRKEDWH